MRKVKNIRVRKEKAIVKKTPTVRAPSLSRVMAEMRGPPVSGSGIRGSALRVTAEFLSHRDEAGVPSRLSGYIEWSPVQHGSQAPALGTGAEIGGNPIRPVGPG